MSERPSAAASYPNNNDGGDDDGDSQRGRKDGKREGEKKRWETMVLVFTVRSILLLRTLLSSLIPFLPKQRQTID